ncbi:hypothetical protein CBS14141_004300 [Malassezia furfur]|nr:hypothetical protein CBS14141_004300 [Malassezia furfur]
MGPTRACAARARATPRARTSRSATSSACAAPACAAAAGCWHADARAHLHACAVRRACTPPLVVERQGGEAWVRTTYVAFADADAGADASVLWALTEHLDASGRAVPGAAADKRTWRLAGAVEALYALPSGDLLAVRADAVVLLADPLHGDAREKDVLRGAFDTRYDTQLLLGADTPSLLPEPTGAALVLVTGGAEGVAVHVVGVYADAAPHLRAHTHAADATPARDVTSAAWLPHATLAVLQRSGALVTRRIRRGMEEDEAPATTTLAPLRGAAARLVGLSASHLLVLALPTGDARKERAAALVWDVGLATVLAQAEWSLGTAPTGARTSAPRPPPRRTSRCWSTCRAPRRGAEQRAGAARERAPRAPAGARAAHRRADRGVGRAARRRRAGGGAPRRAACGAPGAARRARARGAHRAARRALCRVPARRGRAPALCGARQGVAQGAQPALPTPFVQAVLRAALPAAEKGAAQPVAPQTLRYLLERNVVSASMVPGDALVPRVRATGDWSTLYLVLRHVPDLAEAQAVAIVRAALAARADPAAPTVARVLQHVLAPPPFSKPALRMALRTHIVDNDEVLILLDVDAGDLHTLARLSAPLDAFARAEATKGAAKTEAKSKRLALHEASLLVPLYSHESLEV